MPQDTTSLPLGAGAQTGASPAGNDLSASTPSSSSTFSTAPARPSTSEGGIYRQDEHESGYRTSGRAVVVAERQASGPKTSLIFGAALAGAVIGGALPFIFASRSTTGRSRRETAIVEESVTVNRPARELYAFWRDFTNLPQFMNNIKSVSTLDDRRSHWVIKGPAGTNVEFDSRVVEDVPGRSIAWESEEGASVPNRGRVEFTETSSGVTLVRATIGYDPPAGAAGMLVAKLFQKEPGAQARQDLARFKDVMESGRRA